MNFIRENTNDYNAWTRFSSRNIHVANPFFREDAVFYCAGLGSASITGKMFAASVIAHEVIHQSGVTRKDIYGWEAEDLAKTKPISAVNNAENYQFFVTEAYMNAIHNDRSLAWRKCWMDIFIDNYN